MKKQLILITVISITLLCSCSADNTTSYEKDNTAYENENTVNEKKNSIFPNITLFSENEDISDESQNTLFHSGLVPFCDKGYWGYLDKTGSVAITPTFDSAYSFSDGLARVSVQDNDQIQYGFINTDGSAAIDFKFEWASDFYDGMAIVKDNGYIGIIDKKGIYLTNPQYEPNEIGYVANGLFLIDSGNGYSYLYDRNGKKLSEERFESMLDGYGSLLYYLDDYYSPLYHIEGLIPIQKVNGNYCYIDNTGNIILNTDYCDAGMFSDGLAVIGINKGTKEDKKIKYGYINEKGEEVINPQFDIAREFSEGLAAVGMGKSENYSYNWGYIDKKGKYVIDTKYSLAWKFSNGSAVVRKDEKYGLIDKNGNELIGINNESMGSCNCGLIPFDFGGKYGYSDSKGNIVITNQFLWASDFCDDGYAMIAKEDKKIQIIDKSGHIINNEAYDRISLIEDFCKYDNCFEFVSYKSKYCYSHSKERDEIWKKEIEDGTFIEGDWESDDGKIKFSYDKSTKNVTLSIDGTKETYQFELFDEGFGILTRNGSTEYYLTSFLTDTLLFSKKGEDGYTYLYRI